MDNEHVLITKQFIHALQEREQQRPPDSLKLADTAYKKLQYDWPLLTCGELDALTSTLRLSLNHTSRVATPPLTPQLLINITAPVLAAVRPPPLASTISNSQPTYTASAQSVTTKQLPNQAAPHGVAHMQMLESGHVSLGPLLTNGASHDNRAQQEGTLQSVAPSSLLPVTDASHPSLAATYQRLCATVLLDCVQSFLQLPRQDLCAALGSYQSHGASRQRVVPSTPPTSPPPPTSPNAAVLSSTHTTQPDSAVDNTLLDVLSFAQDVYAADSDHDDDEYEPMDTYLSDVDKHTIKAVGDVHARDQHANVCEWEASGGSTTTHKSEAPVAREHLWQTHALPTCSTFLDTQRPLVHGGKESDESEVMIGWLEALAPLRDLACPDHLATLTAPVLQPPPPIPHAPDPAAAAALAVDRGARPGVYRWLWDDEAVVAALLGVIRALGAHEACRELQSLLHDYLAVVVDWASMTSPSRLEGLLSGTWDALGVLQLPPPRRAPRTMTTSRRDPGPYQVTFPEALLALDLVNQVASKVSGDALARRVLWQSVHSHLLPVVERCLTDVSAAAASATHPATSLLLNSSNCRQTPTAEPCDIWQALSVSSQVMVCYVEQRPAGLDPGAALLSQGVLRSLCAAFTLLAAAPSTAAESLRCALLLCCAVSPSALTWCLSVPGVPPALARITPPAAELYAAAARPQTATPPPTVCAHGVVWQFIRQAPADSRTASQPLLLLTLVQGAGKDVESDYQAQLLHDSLQLLLRLQRVCDKTRRLLLPTDLQSAMSSALLSLKGQVKPQDTRVPDLEGSSLQQPRTAVAGTPVDAPSQNALMSKGVDKTVDDQLASCPHVMVDYRKLRLRHWKIETVAALKELIKDNVQKAE